MAGKNAGSILSDLNAAIKRYEYGDYINYITPGDGLNLSDFHKSSLSDKYWVDTRMCYDKDGVRDDMLFELFGSYSADDAITVRATAITEVKDNYEWYDKATYIMNIIKGTDLDSWLNIMKYEGIRGDETTIHALARVYQRHVVVYTKNRPWTTIKPDGTLNEENLWEMCDVHLLYLGQHVYAELKLKPFSEIRHRKLVTDPQMQISAIKSNQANSIVTEPVDLSKTFTEQPQRSDSPMKGANESVKAAETEPGVAPKTDYGQPVFPTAKQILPLHSGFSDAESSNEDDEASHVPTESSGEDVSLSEYITDDARDQDTGGIMNIIVDEADIITRDCKVILKELDKDEINLWTKKNILPEFPEFVAGRNIVGHNIRPKHSPPRLNPRPLRSKHAVNYEDLDDNFDSSSPKRPSKRLKPVKKDGPSADRIAAREYSLRNCSNLGPPASPAKRSAEDAGEQDRKVLTVPDSDIQPYPKPKGKLVVTTHGVKEKKPKQRNFKCPDCDVVEHTRKELNVHFKKSHDRLFCEECGQMFQTPSALERHMYLHTKEDQYPCKHCDEVFPFSSDLQIHTIKHLKHAGYQCGHGKCLKWFKRKGERDKHARTHNAPDLMCDQCDYVTKDVRNLRRHKTSHTDTCKLVCDKCGKLFKWHMQRKCHIESKECKKVNRSKSPEF